MLRGCQAVGLALVSFGVGLLLSVLFPGLCLQLIVSAGCILAGCLLLRQS